MALHQLSDRTVRTVRPTEKERLISDGGGLFLRVLPSGHRSWQFVYSFGKARRKLTLGTTTDVSLAAAREAASRQRARVASGVDPWVALMRIESEQAEQRDTLAAAQLERSRQATTFSEMFEAWLNNGVLRADANAELRRSFEKDVLPSLGASTVKAITDTELRDVLRMVGRSRKRGRSAARLLAELRQMYRWAIKRQPWKSLLVDGNPAELVEARQVVPTGYEPGIRERVLEADELRELRDIFNDTSQKHRTAQDRRKADRPLRRESQLALWICLGTGCRIGELLKARWEDVDMASATWFVPGANTKTRVDWQVYLSDFAVRQFQELRQLTGSGSSPWCFPARQRDSHIDLKTLSKQVGDRQMRFKNRRPLQNRRNDDTLVLSSGKKGEWTPHDLRRTASTMMQALGVSLDVIDRCQNHVIFGSKVRRHYMHHDYAREKSEAWKKLGAQIDAILHHREGQSYCLAES